MLLRSEVLAFEMPSGPWQLSLLSPAVLRMAIIRRWRNSEMLNSRILENHSIKVVED
jgi:hypothetical protein